MILIWSLSFCKSFLYFSSPRIILPSPEFFFQRDNVLFDLSLQQIIWLTVSDHEEEVVICLQLMIHELAALMPLKRVVSKESNKFILVWLNSLEKTGKSMTRSHFFALGIRFLDRKQEYLKLVLLTHDIDLNSEPLEE
jgi:hypothetical protein